MKASFSGISLEMDTRLTLSFRLSVLNDANIIRSSLPSDLFPGVTSDATVHSGFLGSMEK